jgi:hypothetical protein
MTSNRNGGDETNNSSDEFVATAKHDFKWQTQPPKDHLEKLIKATCPHHPYPVKAPPLSSIDEPGRELGGKNAAPIPREEEVVTITGCSCPEIGNTT